jgi:GT2 family glycosyltransferase
MVKVSTPRPITFVVAVKSRGQILEDNFLASPCFRVARDHQILIQENFVSAAKAYNDAIDRAVHDLIIFVHQDIIFPEPWLSQLERALDYLEVEDTRWGVLGCSGVNPDGSGYRHVYSTGLGVTGPPFERPGPVQTLDEIVLILRKSSGLRFDDRLPGFHLYGTDICLRAAKMGMRSYAISAFCIHNTHQTLILAEEFYECCKHVKRVWKDSLPIQTTCIRITRFNMPLYTRRLREVYLRYIRGKEAGEPRVKDVPRLLQDIGSGP